MKNNLYLILFSCLFFADMNGMDASLLVSESSSSQNTAQTFNPITDVLSWDFMEKHVKTLHKFFGMVGLSQENMKLTMARTALKMQYQNSNWIDKHMTIEQASLLLLFAIRLRNGQKPITLNEVGAVYNFNKKQFLGILATIPQSVYGDIASVKLSKKDERFIKELFSDKKTDE